MLAHFLPCCFFFQAEDGIRDFCLSRGLGDCIRDRSATGQNEDELFEIDFGIRYAGSSTMEVVGLCKIDNIVTTTQTPKVRRVSHFFIGVPSTAYVFDVKSTVSGTAGASVTLVKVTRG